MLILARKPGERIVIDGGIIIEVMSVRDGKARLGVTADPSIKIFREELLNKLNHQKERETAKA